VFLIFDDGTNYEFYSGISRIEGTSGLCMGTLEKVCEATPESEIILQEAWSDDQAFKRAIVLNTQRKRLLWLAGYAVDDVADDLGGDFTDTLDDMEKILTQNGPDGSMNSDEWMRATVLVEMAYTLKMNRQMTKALKPLGLLIMLLSHEAGSKEGERALNQPLEIWLERVMRRR